VYWHRIAYSVLMVPLRIYSLTHLDRHKGLSLWSSVGWATARHNERTSYDSLP